MMIFETAHRPKRLTRVPYDQWPVEWFDPRRLEVWVSRDYLVQVFDEGEGVERLSINRTSLQFNGRWKDGLTWEDLQAIKHQIGRGDVFAVEIYPRDRDVVNEANMRHLWLLPEPLKIGWFSTKPSGHK